MLFSACLARILCGTFCGTYKTIPLLIIVLTISYNRYVAERAGFEPAVRYKRTLAFQASALSHSATSPNFFYYSNCHKCLVSSLAASALTAGVLPAALRAAPRFKIAPGDFVSHSATSPNFVLNGINFRSGWVAASQCSRRLLPGPLFPPLE